MYCISFCECFGLSPSWQFHVDDQPYNIHTVFFVFFAVGAVYSALWLASCHVAVLVHFILLYRLPWHRVRKVARSVFCYAGLLALFNACCWRMVPHTAEPLSCSLSALIPLID